MEIIESQNEISTDNDNDYHDDQSDQSKMSVRFYKWGKSDEEKIRKVSRNLSVTDAIESLKQQIALLKRHLFTKRTRASANNEVKDNLKQNDILIHVGYSENYNNKQQWEIQSACFGHASFSIFTACCYFKDESNAINKEAVTVTSETSDHSRSASVSYLQKVIYFIREKYTNLPLKLNVIVWSDGCAAQFCSRYAFSLLSKFEASVNLSWFYNNRHHGKGPWMGLVVLCRILCTVRLSQERLSLMMQRNLPSMPIKRYVSFSYMSSDEVIVVQEEIKTALKIPETFKIHKFVCSMEKEKILRFTSIT